MCAPNDLVLDVGAGTGALTASLVSAGARVVAVELHPGRARQLRWRFRDQPVVVVEADAADLWLPRRPFRVVSNPPFAVTTALFRRLLSPSVRLVSADVVVPTTVAARWANGRGPGARRWERRYEIRVVMPLPAHAFRPAGPVPTALLRIEERGLLQRPHDCRRR